MSNSNSQDFSEYQKLITINKNRFIHIYATEHSFIQYQKFPHTFSCLIELSLIHIDGQTGVALQAKKLKPEMTLGDRVDDELFFKKTRCN